MVYRLGFASTRSEARQLVSHRLILVDGKIVNIPSFTVRIGQKVEVRERARNQIRIRAAGELAEQRTIPDWVEIDRKAMIGGLKRVPAREDLPSYNEHLIVELYSK